MTRMHLQRFAVIVMLLASVACGGGNGDDDDNNPVGPIGTGQGSDPQITNNTDDFQWQLSNASGFSTNGGYTWRNTGTRARVTNSSNFSSGTGTLTVRDSGGRIVFSGNLSTNGTFTTDSGPTGDWRIELAPSGVSGTLSFRVQKD